MDEFARRTLWRIYCDAERGLLDPDIIPLLSQLWRLGVVTTSSCSGRIAIKASKAPWVKRGALIHRWHFMPPLTEFVEAVRCALRRARLVWVSVEPPIVTGYADPLVARVVVDLAVKVGFKYACMRLNDNRAYLIIRGEERIDALVGIEGKLVEDSLYAVYRLAAELLGRGKHRLWLFYRALSKLATPEVMHS